MLGAGEQRGHALPTEGGGGVRLEQPVGEGVEGGRRQGSERPVQPGLDPGAQIGGAPAREAEQQQFVGPASFVVDEVDGAPDQELGLAGTGPRHHELGTARGGDGVRPIGGADAPGHGGHVIAGL